MRLRIGVVLCLLSLGVAAGCRKPLTPNIDRNQPPETWITAAPFDTLVIRDRNGRPLDPPYIEQDHKIPVRFHMYWAGSDKDGAVAGYYYAVTETTTTLGPGEFFPPPLPAPKPSDYHYTTRTDTTFIFNVTVSSPTRFHRFYLYAVDNAGKPDPTPALFTFESHDRFPPNPIIDIAQAEGLTYNLNPDCSVTSVPFSRSISDTFDVHQPSRAPRDTVAVNSRLDFNWHGEITLAGTVITGYQYKLDENDYVAVDSSVHSVSYNTGLPGEPKIAPGVKIFRLRVKDQAGGVRETTRMFFLNFTPDTWFSGPDTSSAQFVQSRDQSTFLGDIRYLDVTGGMPAGGVIGSLLSGDSLKVIPSCRPERKTFFEIWNNRVYAHAEYDTVHMNSWVVLFNGGYDRDSRYSVHVDATDPALPADTSQTPVVVPRPEIGSPVGFRARILTKMDPTERAFAPTQSGLYPIYEPASLFRQPRIGFYENMVLSGKSYALARAEDGDGYTDNTTPADPRIIGDDPGANPSLRRKVLVFYVNKAPFLRTWDGSFVPQANSTIIRRDPQFNLLAGDVDPYDPGFEPKIPGRPTGTSVFRMKMTITGRTASGSDTSWTFLPAFPATNPYLLNTFQFTLNNPPIPNYIVPGPMTIHVELCDCAECESTPGEGRCVQYDIPVNFAPFGEPPSTTSASADRGASR